MQVISILIAFTALAGPLPSQQSFPNVDPFLWNAVLKEFVNEKHRVDYAGLKKDGGQRLNEYIASLGRAGTHPLSPSQTKALLINAYNAFTIQWVVQNYPIASIWGTSSPFAQARHRLGGKTVSLDEIESQLRAMGDPRIHAVLVCAAQSCPPLRREAYLPDQLDDQLDANVREWLANPSLNQFDPSHAKAEISPIFKWYHKDFDAYPGGLEGFLRKYAPQHVMGILGNKRLDISFLDYDWGLNDQTNFGGSYSWLQFAKDWILNWFRGLGGS